MSDPRLSKSTPFPYTTDRGVVYWGGDTVYVRARAVKRRYGICNSYGWKRGGAMWRVWDSHTEAAVGPVLGYGEAADTADVLNAEWRAEN
ncbi:MAG: hypothetical protein AB7P40_19330 [Chloroflexota bacterium]